MEPLEPRPIPPAPPRPEWLNPPPPLPAHAPAVTPMMDFFQRRVEALERELALERERAQTAQTLLGQQEALKSEVDAHLRAISEQLKREKKERDGEEARTHARGRIESLEKRLDEMNATFAQLLREAVSRRDEGPSAGALAAELAAMRAALKDGMDGVARWRGELRELAAVVPQVEALGARLQQDEKSFEQSLGRRLDEFAARLSRSLEESMRAQELERSRLEERVEAMSRERAELSRLWDEQSRRAREELVKERAAREASFSRQVEDLGRALQELGAGQRESDRRAEEAKQALERVVLALAASPKAKDELLAQAEAEKGELLAALRERQETLRRFAEERRAVEKSLGDSLVRMTAELEEERARTRAADARAAERQGELETLKARLADKERACGDRELRIESLAQERDGLAAALAGELERQRRAQDASRAAAQLQERKLEDSTRRAEEEEARRVSAETAAAELRAQLSALAEQVARTLREKDAVTARFADWEKERLRFLETLRKKDEMISLLTSTFQGALKKEG